MGTIKEGNLIWHVSCHRQNWVFYSPDLISTGDLHFCCLLDISTYHLEAWQTRVTEVAKASSQFVSNAFLLLVTIWWHSEWILWNTTTLPKLWLKKDNRKLDCSQRLGIKSCMKQRIRNSRSVYGYPRVINTQFNSSRYGYPSWLCGDVHGLSITSRQ